MLSTTKKKSVILPPPFTPYDWQTPIIKVMIDTVLAGENGLVIQPTATGKSTEAAFVARSCILRHQMKGLYLYDENEGLEQARESFEYIFGKNEISCANFFGYGKDHTVDSVDMVFASFQSLNNHHNQWYTMFDVNHFGFILVNEAHCGQAVTYKKVIDYFNCSKIGLTATPKRMDGKDILEIFDKVIFEMPLEEAIVKGRVAGIEYHVKSHGLSNKKINEICKDVLEEGKRVSIKQLNETIFIDLLDDEVLKEIYLEAFPEDEKPKQTLLFCENIDHANRMGKLLEKDFMFVGVIHSKMGKKHNRLMMKKFRKNEIQFLISVNKLNEDIDVPNVQLVAFLRATDSETVFFQQLGRGLRKLLGKYKLTVLDFVGNCERLILVKELQDRVVEFAKKEGLESLYENNTLNVSGNGFDFQFSDEVINVLKMISAIREGYYKTWQEASEAAVKLGIRNWKHYEKVYKKDIRLPYSPLEVYKDFPGWAIFLKKEIAPQGWLSIQQTLKTVSVSEPTLKLFINEQVKVNKKLKKIFWQKGKQVAYIHPELVLNVQNYFSSRLVLTADYKTIAQLSRDGVGYSTAIQDFAEKFRNKNPEWFVMGKVANGNITEHYHPDLIKKITNEFLSRKEVAGWETSFSVSKKLKRDRKVIKDLVSSFSKTHQHWIKNISKNKVVITYCHPDLVKKIEEHFLDLTKIESESWILLSHICGRDKFSTVKNIFLKYENKYPEWIFREKCKGSIKYHVHPKFAEKISKEVNSRKSPPEGWESVTKISKDLKIKSPKVENFIASFRKSNPKLFGKYYAKNGNEVEYLSFHLIKKIKVYFTQNKEE